jgi:hypothetical protein
LFDSKQKDSSQYFLEVYHAANGCQAETLPGPTKNSRDSGGLKNLARKILQRVWSTGFWGIRKRPENFLAFAAEQARLIPGNRREHSSFNEGKNAV